MHSCVVTVHADMVDEYGHVNYKNLPRLFEVAQDAFIGCRGLSFSGIEQSWGLRSFVVKMTVIYKAQLREGEQVTIKTALALGKTSLTFKQEMEVPQGSVEIEMVVVLVGSDDRPRPIPSELRAALES